MLSHSLRRSVLRLLGDLSKEGERVSRHEGGTLIEASHEEIIDKCFSSLT